MIAAVRFAANKSYKDYVDISKFTEMEIEHGHDTANEIRHLNENGHLHPQDYQDFERSVNSQLSEVKTEALK